MTPVVLVDAQLGNLRSVEKALAHVGAAVTVTGDPDLVRHAERLVVPGQGAFGDCGRALGKGAPLGDAILEFLGSGRPYLGICLGLQVLFEGSDEDPRSPGLGFLCGRVIRIPAKMVDSSTGAPLKVPHMGWNSVQLHQNHPVLGTEETAYYFVHSFHAAPADVRCIAATADYGVPITAAIATENVVATQFHPEKSARAGLALLERFLAWRP